MVARFFPVTVLGNHLKRLALRFCVCPGSDGQQGGEAGAGRSSLGSQAWGRGKAHSWASQLTNG